MPNEEYLFFGYRSKMSDSYGYSNFKRQAKAEPNTISGCKDRRDIDFSKGYAISEQELNHK